MALGLISSIWYLVWVRTGGSGFLGITQLTFGIFGSAVSLVSMVVVSLMTPAPNASTQKMVDDAGVPAGASVIGGQKLIIFLKGRLISPLLFHTILKYKFSDVC